MSSNLLQFAFDNKQLLADDAYVEQIIAIVDCS